MRIFGRPVMFCLFALILAAQAAPLLAQDTLYRLYVLNAETAGNATKAYAINNTGQVVGWMDAGGAHHAAHWFVDVTTDLNGMVHFALQHHKLFNEGYQEAFNISNADQIIGAARHTQNCPPEILYSQAFIMRPAVLTDIATPYAGDALTRLGTLGNPCNGAYDSTGVGISNSNHIVGWADRDDGTTHAFLSLNAGALVDLGTLRNDTDLISAATAVNDDGVVTGYSYTLAQPAGVVGVRAAYHAFIIVPNDLNADGLGDEWIPAAGGGANPLMDDLGTLGGYNSWGRAINNLGQVVGEADTDPDDTGGKNLTRAFVWEAGQMTDLGSLASDGFSVASGVNDDGTIVGWATNADNQRRAALFKDGKVYDLNNLICTVNEDGTTFAPTITLSEARDINEDGWIVGWGDARGSTNTGTRGFLLIPMDADDCPDPIVPGGHTDNGTGSNGGGNGAGTGGDPIVGTPQNLADSQADDPNGGTGGTVTPVGLCGAGFAVAAPLMLLGLTWMKFAHRRRISRKA
jgi:probable HAF family extracellular repeat protein